MGRLLHEAGDAAAAAAQYRSALASRPEDATAEFNLGVALDDLGQTDDAIAAYGRGELGAAPIPLNAVDRLVAIGSDAMMAAVARAL